MNTRKGNFIDSLAKDLHRRRLAVLGEVGDTEGELNDMTREREAEMEEDAQKARIATVLDRLSLRDRQTLEEIDDALKRIVDGTYGKCAACGKPIALARLRALPTTRLCIHCAREREGRHGGAAEEEPAASRLPPDLSLLDDEEIENALYDVVLEAGDIDMEELQISSSDGVVTLQGALPSEAQHQVLLDLLQDVGGLGDIVDHLEIQRIPWERRERSKEGRAKEPAGGEEETENVVQSMQEGVPYRPPLTPPPDEEKE